MTLLNTLNVGGTEFGVQSSLPMGTCATPAGTEIKAAVFADDFELSAGNLIAVTFTYANTYGNGSTTYPKLTVNGANYPIVFPTGEYAGSGAWANGQIITFMYDDTNLVMTSVPKIQTTDQVTSGSALPVTSGGAYNALYDAQYAGQIKNLGSAGWYKIAELGSRNRGQSIIVDLTRGFSNASSEAHHIIIEYGWKTARVCEFAMASIRRFTKIKLCYNENNTDKMGLYIYYADTTVNPCCASIRGLCISGVVPRSVELYNFETDTKTWDTELEFDLGASGFYENGSNLYKLEKSTTALDANLCTANGVYETVGSNVPASSYNWVMEVTNKSDLYCFQKAYQCVANDNDPVIYIRKGRYVNNAWTFSTWKQVTY